MRDLFLYCLCLFILPLSAQIHFEDVSAQNDMVRSGWNSGVAIADFDEDGDEDIYVSVSNGPNLLYENNGDGTFVEVAERFGLNDSRRSYASCWGDIDSDGDLDLIVANRLEPFGFYINNGDGTFEDKFATTYLSNAGKIRSLMLADYDKDGWLDIYVANITMENQLFRNNGNGTFTDVILGARAVDAKLSMGGVFFDYDNDQDQDLYLTRDANQDFVFYENIGDGFFENKSAASGLDYIGQGMGVDVADVNKDGFMDVYVANLFDNILFLNNGDGTFKNITETAKINDYGMSWGTTFFDFDNDGLIDIYSVNDSKFSDHPNVLYRNVGDNVFEQVAENEPISSDWGGYGAAYLDANNDGKLDMFVANFTSQSTSDEGNQLFINRCQNTGNWFRVKTRALGNNTFAVGARISVYAGGEKYIDEVTIGSGYCSHHSYTLHFGLGEASIVDSMSVLYPDGVLEWYYDLPVNATYQARQTQTTSIATVVFKGWDIALRPNPASTNTIIRFNLKTSTAITFSILNTQGQRVLYQSRKTYPSGAHEEGFDVSALPPGVFFIEIQTDQGTTAERFIKL